MSCNFRDTHPKSSKSVKPYIQNLWNYVKDYDYKLIGKPYGIDDFRLCFNNYSENVLLHDKIPEIDYAELSLGNSLGIAQGISISKPESKIFVFISDSQLNMGNVLEAVISIGARNQKNILLAVDYNNSSSKGILNKILEPNLYIFYKWNIIYNKNYKFNFELDSTKPNVIIFDSCKEIGSDYEIKTPQFS